MVRKLLQTSVVVVVQLISPEYDLFYAMFISLFALTVHAFANPYKKLYVNLWQTAVLSFHAFVVLVCIGEKYTADETISWGVDVFLVVSLFVLTVGLGCAICVSATHENWSMLSEFASKIRENPYVDQILVRLEVAQRKVGAASQKPEYLARPSHVFRQSAVIPAL
eukprot:gene18597-22207_t